MNKKDLQKALAKETNIPLRKAKTIISTILDSMAGCYSQR